MEALATDLVKRKNPAPGENMEIPIELYGDIAEVVLPTNKAIQIEQVVLNEANELETPSSGEREA